MQKSRPWTARFDAGRAAASGFAMNGDTGTHLERFGKPERAISGSHCFPADDEALRPARVFSPRAMIKRSAQLVRAYAARRQDLGCCGDGFLSITSKELISAALAGGISQ